MHLEIELPEQLRSSFFMKRRKIDNIFVYAIFFFLVLRFKQVRVCQINQLYCLDEGYIIFKKIASMCFTKIEEFHFLKICLIYFFQCSDGNLNY